MAVTKRTNAHSLKQLRAVLYGRVSTNNQSAEMQMKELREFARHRSFRITHEYVDLGVSGSKERRPALDELMSDAQRRKFDVLIVWDLSRFARSLRHLVNALAEFESLRVSFVSLRDNLDLTTPSGRLMFQVIGAMAEFERALIRERVKAGIANARRNANRSARLRNERDQLRHG